MIKHTGSLWHRIEPLLGEVGRPVRYINHELCANSLGEAEAGTIETSSSTVDMAFVYPDVYEIGQSNQAIAILYDILRDVPDTNVERTFLPWLDMIALLREYDIPLFSLESYRELAAFDLVGITIPHELSYTNILEVLDLAHIPLYAKDRSEDAPLVIGGGPCVFNPEPFAPFFDAICIGEGEEAIIEMVESYRTSKICNASRAETLQALATIEGVYIPTIHNKDNRNVFITKRVLADLDKQAVVLRPIVPFTEVTHDRFTVEILRGCTRGCRFCQAGMTNRPVRERKADTIIRAVCDGLARSGYDEVSLTSLSSTDHSQIQELIYRLNQCLDGKGIRLSIPSQRLDSFGVEIAHLIASGEKKTSLTFAPEAGTQRLRDRINKNVSEQDLIEAIKRAYSMGWRRCKLYFMIGLPGETDDDVRGIAQLANLAYRTAKDAVPDNQRNNCRMSISVALFVPKAQTPFQWYGQISHQEALRRLGLIREAHLHRGIDLQWHDPAGSLIEAIMSRGGCELAPLIVEAWRLGARFDAWSEQFSFELWQRAADTLGIDLDVAAQRTYALDEALPWDHISSGVSKDYLICEYEQALNGVTTPDCSFEQCVSCGVCSACGVDISLGGPKRE